MSLPRIATREEWLAARMELLAKEKNLTRQRDALSTERRNLPMAEIVKDYQFDGPDGRVRLIDIFEGRPQLMICHFMFHPEWEEGCPSCSAGTNELLRGFLDHLHVGTRPPGPTSTTTSASRSTPLAASASTTTAPSTSTRPRARRA